MGGIITNAYNGILVGGEHLFHGSKTLETKPVGQDLSLKRAYNIAEQT